MSDSDKTILGKLENIKHIHRVRHFLALMIEELDHRARVHDLSKLESPEAEIFGEHAGLLADAVYGSPEYENSRQKTQIAREHHYAKNRHHPEHWKDGINDMTLIDLVEMLADWRAATERNKNGNIRRSIQMNKDKYEISDQLARIMENTVRETFKE